MPNVLFDMTSEGQEDLTKLFDIVCGSVRKAVGYAIREAVEGKRWDAERLKDPRDGHLLQWYTRPRPMRLVFFWTTSDQPDFVAFPFKVEAKGIADFSMRWLEETDYGKEPSTDGHNQRGWRAYCESWGHVDEDWRAFIAVSPKWITYGK